LDISTGQLWVLGAIVLLCFWLADISRRRCAACNSTSSASPGRFSARTNSKRRDELGQLARTFDQMAERIQNLVAAQRRLLLTSRMSCAHRWRVCEWQLSWHDRK